MNTTPRSSRTQIVLIGRCNTGKSSLLNCLTGQQASLVAEQAGTTADPVAVAFELLPHGPVTFYDTAGIDEQSPLGELRRKAALHILEQADAALLVVETLGEHEYKMASRLAQLEVPFLIVFTKQDLRQALEQDLAWCRKQNIPFLLSRAEQAPALLREGVLGLLAQQAKSPPLVTDLVPPGGVMLCVTPIDASAPKGRLILPQVQVLRELVEENRLPLLCQHTTFQQALAALVAPPALVVTDSQVVMQVAAQLEKSIPLTTFSLLFARLKGDFALQLAGAQAISALPSKASVLVAEACSHHQQDDDIARVKLPRMLRQYLGHELAFTYCAGKDFPADLERYQLVLHCGGCMLHPKEMRRRLRICAAHKVPVTNYGMAISLTQGLLDRVSKVFLP